MQTEDNNKFSYLAKKIQTQVLVQRKLSVK